MSVLLSLASSKTQFRALTSHFPYHLNLTDLTQKSFTSQNDFSMLIVAFICLVASEAANLTIPIIVSNAYETLIEGGYEGKGVSAIMSSGNAIMIKVIIIYFSKVLIEFFQSLIQGIVGERLIARLRCKLYAAILKQEIAFFDKHKTGELVSRLGSNTTLLQSVILQSIPEVRNLPCLV